MLKSAKVPEAFRPPFERAEKFVEELFAQMERKPEQGVLRIGGQRYVLMRSESLYLSWFDALAETFGEQAAAEFIYNTAREIGKSDSADFAERLQVQDEIERLSAGPIHFAHAGWARVEILDDSAPAPSDSYFLHYIHPNTFESEVLKTQNRKTDRCACLFSAGYSAGWCSQAFGLGVQARELRCTACGDDACEFIMAPSHNLDEHENRIRQGWDQT
jgi:predicted hydrocarbon binding protein